MAVQRADIEHGTCPACDGPALYRVIDGERVGACSRWGCWWVTGGSGSEMWRRGGEAEVLDVHLPRGYLCRASEPCRSTAASDG